jgi:hypothetical protein
MSRPVDGLWWSEATVDLLGVAPSMEGCPTEKFMIDQPVKKVAVTVALGLGRSQS